VGNSLKFTHQGHVRVSATESADGRGLVLKFEDTGPGIPKAKLDNLFKAFEQARIITRRHVLRAVPQSGSRRTRIKQCEKCAHRHHSVGAVMHTA
jgi:signal transduction histidine kinase